MLIFSNPVVSGRESETYINYNKEKLIPKPKPIGKIQNKYQNDMVSHYNYAAKLGSTSKLSPSLKHIIVTLPGTGTHMSIKGLALIGESFVYGTHVTYDIHYQQLISNAFNNVKKIVMVRDPRDWICSQNGLKRDSDLTPEVLAKIKQSLSNPDAVYRSYERILKFAGLKNVLFIRFEDLQDHELQSGNRYTKREMALIKMGNFLGLPLNDKIIKNAANNLLGDTWNYEKKEHVNYWKKYFDQEAITLCNKNLGKLIEELGYAKVESIQAQVHAQPQPSKPAPNKKGNKPAHLRKKGPK